MIGCIGDISQSPTKEYEALPNPGICYDMTSEIEPNTMKQGGSIYNRKHLATHNEKQASYITETSYYMQSSYNCRNT